MSQLALLSLSVTMCDSKSSSSSHSSTPPSEQDGPAVYHTNLASLLPTLRVPPPLRGMQRLRAVAQRQCVGGIDVLGILAKVVMRPRPVINLGPIDHTASCVIVDLDRQDKPIVWASESFCQMSGYALEHILGRNPRFMQAPGGHVLTPDEDAYIPPPDSHVAPGSERTHTDKGTVAMIKQKLDAHEEVQATVLNYRRDGTPFWNWLSVVPVREAGEGSRFRYHVGIMVDLVQQPRAIIQTMQAGFYVRTQS